MHKQIKIQILKVKVSRLKKEFVELLQDDYYCIDMYVDELFLKVDEELDEQIEKISKQEEAEKV